MSKDNAFRELKFSPSQLVVVFLAILLLGIFVFLLGISVGKKQSQLLAQAGSTPQVKTESVTPKTPVPADVTTSVAPAQPESKPAVTAGQKPETKAGEKPAPTEKPAPAKPEPSAANKPAEDKTTVPDQKLQETKAAPEAKPAPKKSAAPPAGLQGGPYYVQVSAVEDKEAAAAYARKIAALGYATIVLEPLTADKRPVYRVRVGPYETKSEAADEMAKIAAALKKKKTDFFVVKG